MKFIPNFPNDDQKLEQLQQGKLHGAELLLILRHLEDCDQCYRSLPPQNPQNLIEIN